MQRLAYRLERAMAAHQPHRIPDFSQPMLNVQGVYNPDKCRCVCQNEALNEAGYCIDPKGRCTVRHRSAQCRLMCTPDTACCCSTTGQYRHSAAWASRRGAAIVPPVLPCLPPG